MTNILGIHHVTAIASDPQRNVDFYVGFLGLRLVKRTVNFDDPQTYHLYYGDEQGNPGSIMTFFPWPGARRGRQGVGQAAVTAFSARPESIGFWVQRLIEHGIKYEGPTKRGDGETVLSFRDHDGLLLEIVGHAGAASRPSWTHAHGIPAEHAIHGFHAVTLWVNEHAGSERVLVDTLGFTFAGERDNVRRFIVGDGGPGKIIDVRAVGGFVEGVGGAGTVHHIAWAVADDEAELQTRQRLVEAGLRPTPVIDRNYFHSVYFREPGGVLYELATNPPGFAIDEPANALGEQLMLPAQYEANRAEIDAVLPPIHLPVALRESTLLAAAGGPEDVSGDALGFVHRYLPPAPGALAASTTLLLLHGTGGDENDLIELGRALVPGAGMLSPRGNVLERGMPRFFRRHAEGVFDLEDLAARTDELAQFVEGASATYGLARRGVVAVGFSNGANIASSLLLRRGPVIRRALLLSPMVPFEPSSLPDLSGVAVFIGSGKADPIVPTENVDRLAELLQNAGADVTVYWTRGGHTITKDELDEARRWLTRLPLPV